MDTQPITEIGDHHIAIAKPIDRRLWAVTVYEKHGRKVVREERTPAPKYYTKMLLMQVESAYAN